MVIAEVHQRCNCVSAASWECRCKLWNFTISWMHSSMITYTLNSAVSIFPTSLQGLDSYWAIGPYHRPNGHSAQSTGPLKMAQNELGQFGPQIFILGHFERWVCEYGTSIQNRCVAGVHALLDSILHNAATYIARGHNQLPHKCWSASKASWRWQHYHLPSSSKYLHYATIILVAVRLQVTYHHAYMSIEEDLVQLQQEVQLVLMILPYYPIIIMNTNGWNNLVPCVYMLDH